MEYSSAHAIYTIQICLPSHVPRIKVAFNFRVHSARMKLSAVLLFEIKLALSQAANQNKPKFHSRLRPINYGIVVRIQYPLPILHILLANFWALIMHATRLNSKNFPQQTFCNFLLLARNYAKRTPARRREKVSNWTAPQLGPIVALFFSSSSKDEWERERKGMVCIRKKIGTWVRTSGGRKSLFRQWTERERERCPFIFSALSSLSARTGGFRTSLFLRQGRDAVIELGSNGKSIVDIKMNGFVESSLF